MKITARQAAKYGGCAPLYKLHIQWYGPNEAVDYDTWYADFKKFEASLPEDADTSWIDWGIVDRFTSNPDAVIECSDEVEYLNEYRTHFKGEIYTEKSPEKILDKIVALLGQSVKSPKDFFNLNYRYVLEFKGKEIEVIFEHSSPKNKGKKPTDYIITKRDATREIFKTLKEAENRIAELYEDWIDMKVSQLVIEQKIIGDGRFEAWKRIS